MDEADTPERKSGSERDIIALGIATAAIILFVGTGGSVLSKATGVLTGNGPGPDSLLVSTMMLNIALIIFGWRRHRELTHEIAERRKAEAVARKLAETDPLTDCLNRRSMEQATNQLRRRSNAHGKAVAFVMVDLDNFKQINDMNGHTVGDKVLGATAARLRENLPADAPLARLGGDEFAFAMAYDPVHPERIDDLVARLFAAICSPIAIEETTIHNTVSIGIASDHFADGRASSASDGEMLMHHADIAMYQAKRNGKNRYFWFEANMENELRFRNELERGIRQGVVRHEFEPYYEQQIDLETGELVGFEMLARWNSPELGVVNPDVFIPIAEEIGLISEISEQLIVQAFADAKKWAADLTLSVNISPVQMRDQWFSQRLLKLLVEHNFPPQRLEIEITETALHDNISLVKTMISSLRNQGVKVSLDDFGTGYASLSQLRTLPFDRIKIDRSFVRELGDKEGSKIVDAIVSLGNGLEMPITAEGIENEVILEGLRELGQLKGQGYLYGRPEPAEKVIERLREQGRLATRAAVPAPDRTDEEQEQSQRQAKA